MTRAKVRECPTLPLLRLHREQRVELVDGVWTAEEETMDHQTPRITVTDASGYTWVNCASDISSTMFYAIDHAGNMIYVTIEHPPTPLPWWARLMLWDWRRL